MAATPYEILTFVGRGTSVRDYQRLKAALDRLQSTTVATSIRQPAERRMHRFSWINEWKERADIHRRPQGLELILPDWFYAGVLDNALILTIDEAYFHLTGGLERWLYRLVRKHGPSSRRLEL
jgi:plasmid replication initiation protein